MLRKLLILLMFLVFVASCGGFPFRDSILDLGASFYVTQADAGETNETGDQLGAALAVGDFNGDGFEDLAQGAPGENGGTGAVSIFLGSEAGIATGSLITQRDVDDAAEAGDQFGAALTVGDFNFDGFEDLAVGAPGEVLETGPRSGAVYVFLGGPGGLGQGVALTQADAGGVDADGDEFGAAMATGDMDGDGFEDLVVGAPGDAPDGGPRSGAVYIFPGSHNGLIPGQGYVVSQNDVIGEQNEDGDRFGAALETGQFNGFGGVDIGDGFADLAVGAPGEAPGSDPQSGAVFLFLGDRGRIGVDSDGDGVGGPGFILTQANAVGLQNRAGDRFGAELGVGDSNNDGVEELAVGAPGKNRSAGTVVVFVADPNAGLSSAFVLSPEMAGGMSQAGDEFGAALAFGVLDQNGFEELAVGAPGKFGNAGAVYVYLGEDGNRITTGFTINQVDAGGVDEIGDRFGATLSIEDFNDNNAADLAVGAPGDGSGSGAVFVFPGVPTSPPRTDQERAGGINEEGDQFGAAEVSGDFNGDGFADLAVGAPGEDAGAGAVSVFLGAEADRPGITITTGSIVTQRNAGGIPDGVDQFGAALGVGDFDGDGFDDLAVGAPGENGAAGAVFVLPGSTEGITSGFFITETHAGDLNRANERFGAAVAAGDFNGDGYDDLVVGAPFEQFQSGTVFVFPGSRAGIRLGFSITQSEAGDLNVAGDHFGAALGAGDFDGDGFEDLTVGAPGNLGAGAVFVFPGTAFGIRTGFFRSQTYAGLSDDLHDRFGAALTAGDFDGDGFEDLAVGAPGKNFGAGAAFVFPGSVVGIRLGFFVTQSDAGDADQSFERFGSALAAADGNDDGFDELVVGAPEARPDRVTTSGVVFMFPGGEAGIHQGFPIDQAGNGGSNEAEDDYGASLAFDDFDGDGLADLAVGAPGEAPDGPALALGPAGFISNPKSGAVYMVDDDEIERLIEEFERQQQTNDPLPPLP